MVELTVGYVAGLVAFGIFLAQIWSPTALVLYLSGLLRDRETVATWSVAGRSLHKSYWPEILGADTAKSHGVRTHVLLTTLAGPAITFLIAVAAVITPLGLYESMEPSGLKAVEFVYKTDPSPFGAGTPPRGNIPLSRACSEGFGMLARPASCPYSEFPTITKYNGSTYSTEMPWGYDASIPPRLREIYSSGTQGVRTTVSNYFDIEWRQTVATYSPYIYNGTEYPVGTFRQIQSLVTDEIIKPVEGLLANLKSGGLGFRNHTIPLGLTHGATWTEDLLFIEPETECVNTNLTIDFTVTSAQARSGVGGIDEIAEMFLTDRGGFANLNRTYPEYDRDHAHVNAELRARAYKAAWLNNAYSMMLMNITNPRNDSTGQQPFSYLKSEIGKQFPLPLGFAGTQPTALLSSRGFGSYLEINKLEDNNFTNPWGITKMDHFDSISTICSGAGDLDYSNITNIFVVCGLIRPPPVRVDGGSSLVWDRGSKWSSPMYACASTVKAKIKTVTFNIGNSSDFGGLTVLESKDRTYQSEREMPLWAVEDSGMRVGQIEPFWGIVSSEYQNYPNVSTIRQPSLYLPGYSSPATGVGITSFSVIDLSQNLPASDFWKYAMADVYGDNIEFNTPAHSGVSTAVDYGGYTSVALLKRWQDMAATPQGAAKIVDLIWTDLSAQAVVGTKGVLGHNNAGLANETVSISVRPIARRIKYHLKFAIPAFVAALVILIVSLLALCSAVKRRSPLNHMRKRLNQTSAGRLYSWLYWPEADPMHLSTTQWSGALGTREVDVNARDEREMVAIAQSGAGTYMPVGTGVTHDVKGPSMTAAPVGHSPKGSGSRAVSPLLGG
ncbi:hypothetical protein M011DRAFT_412228 [Sporormia fimetaria CBS 119925]|uniref:Uncharacterized protein n=1 Tax=Sporormia fimetaria CBS 119925 TaxID=1340428 RepID=A0A6A6UWK4_9PLEO|nr:hypothetical protein M011DRAFT_412228 [Sporormia fimetaria CBS 119925]